MAAIAQVIAGTGLPHNTTNKNKMKLEQDQVNLTVQIAGKDSFPCTGRGIE